MSNNIIKRTWKQGGLVNIEDLRGSAFQAEDGGHTFLISGLDENGDTLALSGTPAGVLLRADGQDVTLTCSVSEGVVSATLPANAYVVPGRVGITIFLTSGGQKTAIYAAVGSVATTSSGIVAPPAGSDVVDLVNAIATAVATIPASYTDLMAAVAPTYSTSALYAVGSYAWYSGKLYRCTTAITSGETWTSAHWTQANLGSDVSDLKSAIDDGQKLTGNLFRMDGNRWTYNGVTVINNRDGTYTANGTATASTYLNFCEIVVDAPKTLTAKIVEISGTGPSAGIRFFPQNSAGSNYGNFGPGTHTRDYVVGDKLRFRIAQADNVLTDFVFAIYISEGDTAIEEPYSKWISEYSVRYDESQSLTDNEKAQALENIGGASEQTTTDIKKSINAIDFTTQTGASDAYFEYDRTNECMFMKVTGKWYLRGFVSNGSGEEWSTIVPGNRYTSTKGVSDCIKLTSNQAIVYDTSDSTWKIVTIASLADTNSTYIIVFWAGYYEAYKRFGIVGGIGQWMYLDYCAKIYAKTYAQAIADYGTYSYATQATAVVNSVLADRDSNTITFGLITDTHHRGSYNAVPQVNIFNRMCEKCADFTVHLGDTIQGMQTLDVNYQYITQYAEAQNDTFLPFMYTIAHHEMYGRNSSTDYLNDPTAIPMESVLGILGRTKWIAPVYSVSKDNWYFDMMGIRFISLDSVHNTTNGFNQEAIDFLTSAVNTQNKIIVFAHVAANANVNWKNKNPVNGSQIESILNGSSADVLAYMHGHTHWDNTVVVSGNNFPYISTCCALAEKMSSSDYCSLGTPTAYDREVGSYSEYCFDIVNVHTDTGAIKSFRFGVGSDRTYTQPA